MHPYAGGLDELDIQVKRGGRNRRILVVSGALTYYTEERFVTAYHNLIKSEGRGMRRLVLDLHLVHQFDTSGATALCTLVRDAETRLFQLLIDDRWDRPLYLATGLRYRVKFVAEEKKAPRSEK